MFSECRMQWLVAGPVPWSSCLIAISNHLYVWPPKYCPTYLSEVSLKFAEFSEDIDISFPPYETANFVEDIQN